MQDCARVSASEKDLPVHVRYEVQLKSIVLGIFFASFVEVVGMIWESLSLRLFQESV